jgi:hypothetical protein
MADLLDPKEGDQPELPPQVMQIMQKLQQENQALDAFGKQAQEQIAKLEQEKQAKVIDNQARMEIEKLKIEAQVTIAEIGAKAQETQTRLKMEQAIWMELHGSAHEVGMVAVEHAQNMEQGQQAAQYESTDSNSEDKLELNL